MSDEIIPWCNSIKGREHRFTTDPTISTRFQIRENRVRHRFDAVSRQACGHTAVVNRPEEIPEHSAPNVEEEHPINEDT